MLLRVCSEAATFCWEWDSPLSESGPMWSVECSSSGGIFLLGNTAPRWPPASSSTIVDCLTAYCLTCSRSNTLIVNVSIFLNFHPKCCLGQCMWLASMASFRMWRSQKVHYIVLQHIQWTHAHNTKYNTHTTMCSPVSRYAHSRQWRSWYHVL